MHAKLYCINEKKKKISRQNPLSRANPFYYCSSKWDMDKMHLAACPMYYVQYWIVIGFCFCSLTFTQFRCLILSLSRSHQTNYKTFQKLIEQKDLIKTFVIQALNSRDRLPFTHWILPFPRPHIVLFLARCLPLCCSRVLASRKQCVRIVYFG